MSEWRSGSGRADERTRRGARAAREGGFTLVETLVALLLTLVVAGAAYSLLGPATAAADSGPEALDLQQRARAAVDAVARDLYQAGAGVDAGPRAGPLAQFLAPVLPRRIGLVQADPPGTARADAVSILHVPATWTQSAIAEPAGSNPARLVLEALPSCARQPACGAVPGTSLLVFDGAGAFDIFAVTGVTSDAVVVRAQRADRTSAYPAGSAVAEVEMRVYYHDAAARQLRQYDGYRSDTPVVDGVVGFEAAYFGDPAPPVRPRPPDGVENCLYTAAGDYRGPVGDPATDALVRIPLDRLADGPWCGDGGHRYDADLLRVRLVRLTVRVEAEAAYRGAGARFARAGFARAARRMVPDETLAVDVALRNLAGRLP